MKTEGTISHPAKWEDIVFENRNKEYGAYFIRKIYNKHVIMASAIMLLLAVLVIAGLYLVNRPDPVAFANTVANPKNLSA